MTAKRILSIAVSAIGFILTIGAILFHWRLGPEGITLAILASTSPSLLDLANRMDPNGTISKIAEVLNRTNEILEDIPFVECNDGTGHQTTIRTGLPGGTYRRLYGGVQPTKSTTAKISDSTAMLENYGEIDKALADINGNTAAFRFSEDKPAMQGMSHTFASNVFYGNEKANPERFTGLAARYSTVSTATAQTAANVIDGGGTGGTNTSIWLVVWSENTVHGIYPAGSKVGLQMKDLGEATLENAPNGGGRMQIYRTHFRWDHGICVRDWRYVVRIANVDVALLTKDAASGDDLIDLMTQAVELVENLSDGTPGFYVNRRVRSFLRRQMVAKIKSSTLTWEMVAGKRVMMFDEVPVRRCDDILNTEAQVV